MTGVQTCALPICWESPGLTAAGVADAAALGDTFRLMRRLRRQLRGLDALVLPGVLNADFAALDAAMRRPLLIARHGCYPPDARPADCDAISAHLDRDPWRANCPV